MDIKTLNAYLLGNLTIMNVRQMGKTLFVKAKSNTISVTCPICGCESGSKHSQYERKPQDLPWAEWRIILNLQVKRFFCHNARCKKKTFAERFPEILKPFARQTNRAKKYQQQISLEMAAKTAEKILGVSKLPLSDTGVNRMIRGLGDLMVENRLKVVGIDDWALKKGCQYGTIIIDHETGEPIDLLPKRDCETVKQWLENYPTIAIVTRDRSGEYRKAITQALPDAVQIADRWHLLKNLGETIQRHITRRHQAVSQIVAYSISGQTNPTIKTKQRRYDRGPTGDAIHIARTEKREALFAAVKTRRAAGALTADIAKEFNLSRQTVSKWVNRETLPPDTRGRFKEKCLIDEYVPYLRKRILAGCHNQTQLWREICAQGFTGKRTLVGRWVRQNYKTNGQALEILPHKNPNVIVPGTRELAWLLIRHTDELEEEEKRIVNALIQDDSLAELRQLAHQFINMMQDGASHQWQSWLKSCCESAVQELRNFAVGLKKDEAAIYEAIRQPWSNGRVEGHVNRLKTIKRMMYGRAKFDLLRKRVLLQGKFIFT